MPKRLQVQEAGLAHKLPRWTLPRAGRVARVWFTGHALMLEVTVGDALDTLTHEVLRAAIREAVGPPGDVLSHTCDVIVDETCRQWPEQHMASLARRAAVPGVGIETLDALAVVTARVREQIEARWKCRASEHAALSLVLQMCVAAFANLWFSAPEARIAMRAIIADVRGAARA